MRKGLQSTLLMFALSSALSLSLGATTVTVDPSQMTTTMTGVATNGFNNGMLPGSFTATGPNAGVVTGSLLHYYLAPTGDNTYYAYVGANSTLTEKLGTPGVGVNYFGLLWGSGDYYNSLTFTDTKGNQITYGNNGINIPGVTDGDSDPTAYVNFMDTGNNWVSVTFASDIAAFEFDNVSSGLNPAPEPASLPLLAAGLLVAGAGVFRRRKAA